MIARGGEGKPDSKMCKSILAPNFCVVFGDYVGAVKVIKNDESGLRDSRPNQRGKNERPT